MRKVDGAVGASNYLRAFKRLDRSSFLVTDAAVSGVVIRCPRDDGGQRNAAGGCFDPAFSGNADGTHAGTALIRCPIAMTSLSSAAARRAMRVAAICAAQLGFKTRLVERDQLGGICSTGAASRPRRCCARRKSSTRCTALKILALSAEGHQFRSERRSSLVGTRGRQANCRTASASRCGRTRSRWWMGDARLAGKGKVAVVRASASRSPISKPSTSFSPPAHGARCPVSNPTASSYADLQGS